MRCRRQVSNTRDREIRRLERIAESGLAIHHSGRGVQYVSICYTGRLAGVGMKSSVDSVADSYDNALAETINGSYKAEVIHRSVLTQP